MPSIVLNAFLLSAIAFVLGRIEYETKRDSSCHFVSIKKIDVLGRNENKK